MKDLRVIIANNISALRTEAGLTQLKLAERLNYSDKAVSKWERGESVPDIFMLKKIADDFGVTVDYLLTEDHRAKIESDERSRKISGRNRMLVSFLAAALVWFIATAVFVVLNVVAEDDALFPAWLAFIYAIPISSIVVLVFNTIWGRAKLNYLIISVLVWTFILSVYISVLTMTPHNVWILFMLGIPSQIIIIFWSGITKKGAKK